MAPIMLDSGDLLGLPHNGLGGQPEMLSLDGQSNLREQDRLESIAIVGYSFRFPGDATDSKAFWKMMMEQRCVTSDTPEDRISIPQWQHPDGRRRGQYSSHGGHYLKEDVSLFDAPFFSLSADEAAALDPQHRHLMEVTYRALENAGIPMEKAVGSQTSVHVGCFNGDYRLMACKDVEITADYDVVGMQMSMNANRLSWFFDFRGTSMNIDTACSSSLIALDLACQGLRSRETNMGVVAGTNLILSADMNQAFSNVNMLSPDARSYSFDHRANGYGRGEGTGTLVIKRLADAIRDGDTIRAVIRSAGSNQDGLTPSGIMQPSGTAQAGLIRDTYARAGLSMEPTRFFEAHGTGTQVGDPIECNALGDAFRGVRTMNDPLFVGAVKSNIGHLEGASGIAAVIKTILILESDLIPPNTNFEKINPKIDLEFLGLQYVTDLAHTLNTRRSVLPYRSFWTASTLEDLRDVLKKTTESYQSVEKPVLGFVFTGQGSQWVGMGRELFKYPVYRNTIWQCEHDLQSFGCPWSLQDELLREDASSRINDPEIAQPANTALQIAMVDLFHSVGVNPAVAIGHSSGEIAAAYAAGALSTTESMRIAYFRGVCATKLSQTQQPAGAMIAASLSESDARGYIDEVSKVHDRCGLQVACINSQKSVTISGDEDQTDTLKNLLDSYNIFARKLKVPVAYHSSHMKKIASVYKEQMNGLQPTQNMPTKSDSCVMISSVTGEKVVSEELRMPQYWVDNLTSPVQFAQSLLRICTESGRKIRKKLDGSHRSQLGVNVLLEVGPQATLQRPIRDLLETLSWGQEVNYYSAIRRGQNAASNLLDALGHLHCLGLPVDLGRVNRLDNPGSKHARVLIDLPEYPFNHSTAYWRESRVSRRLRLAAQGKLDLLGKPVTDCNPLEARWRHHIRVSDMPWVEDHVVNGTLIYPAAGMLVMAIEAANQMASPNQKVDAFQLRNVKFQRALTVPRTADGVETNLHLRTSTDSSSFESSWLEFRLCSLDDDDTWQDNCHGFIKVKYQNTGDHLTERTRQFEDCLQLDDSLFSACTMDFSEDGLYRCLNQSGFEFGPAFHTVFDGKCSKKHQARSSLKVFPWPADQYPQPHIVHPTTLDGILHLTAAALSEGGQTRVPTAVPTGIQNLWISKEGLSHPSAAVINVSTWVKSLHSRGHEFDICAMDEQRTRVLAKVDGLQSTIVADSPWESFDNPDDKLTVHHLHHFPALDLLDADQLAEYCAQSRPQDPEPLEYFRDVNFVLFKFLGEALDNLGEVNSEKVLPHIQHYIDWAKLQRSKFEAGELPLSRPEWNDLLRDTEYFQSACDRLSASNAQGYAFVHTGSNLLPILRGEQDPIQFLWKDDMMSNFYRESNDRDGCFDTLGFYLRTQAQQNPALRILEIGAGTGGTTAHILKALSQGSGISPSSPLYTSYDYTDISPAFFDTAAKRFKNFPRMNFRVLDVMDDLAAQGFELESYDLVVAANVLHATPDIRATMRNVRKLLKPNGKVTLFEITRPEIIRSGFVAGLMGGWWAGKDDNRIWSPAMTGAQWDTTFKDTGLSGVEMEIPEFINTECQENSILVTKASSTTLLAPLNFYFVFDERSITQKGLYEQATERLKSEQPASIIAGGSLNECIALPCPANTTLIFIQETEAPLLDGMSQKTFSQLQNAVTHCNSILWVTAGGGRFSRRPEYTMIDGWARTLRAEHVHLRMVTLALDVAGQTGSNPVSHITRVLTHELLDLERTQYEPEFVEIDGLLHVTRIKSSKSLTDDLHAASLPRQFATKSLSDAGPVKLSYKMPGLLDTLHWSDDNGHLEHTIQPGEVEMNVHAVGLNFRDCEIALGKDPKTAFGQECAGNVTCAGKVSGFKPGDRVVAFGPGKFKTTVRTGVDSICRIPDALSVTEAASIPSQFGVAWHAIVDIARLQKGESILIHAGAGGSGQAAIQIAQYIGAEIYATTSTQEKQQILSDVYGIPAGRIFYSRDTSFADPVIQQTKGRGVDVVVNTLAGDILLASWDCIANYGRLVDIGCRGSLSSMSLPMAQPGRRASFTYFDGVNWMNERPEAAKRGVEIIFNLFAEGKLHLHKPLHIESASNLEDAFRLMQSGSVIGKVVFEISPEVHVPTVLKTRAPFKLDTKATYVVAGGLGGLGRTVARWMASRGAKHLVLLGRSGAKTKAALVLVDELEAQDVQVKTPPCDVVDSKSVNRVIQEVMQTMPPIKGCIQGSMVLRDQPFERMSYEEWQTAVDCKVSGTWNLEMSLPRDLDFFIMFSSANGLLGIPSQSNYGAGNSYSDGFVRYRVSNGQKAVSLDLGVMSDDGLLAETPDLLEKVIGYGNGSLLPVSRPKFLGLLDHYCNPDRPLLTPETSQVVVGIAPGGDGFVGNTLLEKPLFNHLKMDNITSDDTSKVVEVQFQKLFSEATSLEEGREIVAKALINKLTHSYKVIPEDAEVDMDTPLHTFRIDSLLAVELCNWIRKEFAADLAVLEVMGGATLAMVDVLVATRSQLRHPEWI
ncbi:Type I Iterative Polyketide synthase (PKS) [Aspergillus melleus]|uniref:Type I Iterative Polyketide synthase (PKS) n=1 Tax=Aspergillus melleus TaxID=138277 RepID=A0ACC3B1B7_9EURO|nr:Type I Iterative Polyketide synthase (PKS) [Aspergillus melleus]